MRKPFGNTVRVLVLAGCIGLAAPASAAVPDGIDYQGYLTNTDGSAFDGDITMTFAAYNVDIGGAPLWSQSQIVPVDQGLFSVTLGTPVNPFPGSLFDNPVYVGMTVAGEELLPRRALNSTAYSFKAGDANTLGGATAAALNQSAHVADTSNPHAVTAVQTGAASIDDALNLQAQLDAALADIATLQSNLAAAIATISALQADVTANDADISSLEFGLGLVSSGLTTVADSVVAIENNSVLDLDGVLTLNGTDTALFTGVNVQVVNGDGLTASVNGRGNVIVGYNDVIPAANPMCSRGQYSDEAECLANFSVWSDVHKSGSHNVVIGAGHNYSSVGGLVAGYANSITGFAASVPAGTGNSARGTYSIVSGGGSNTALGNWSSVSGGVENTAPGIYSSISGGRGNEVNGESSTISGGRNNVVDGDYSSISGGELNSVSGAIAGISGGRDNSATDLYATVSGGRNNVASGIASSVSGGGGDVASEGNIASGPYSSISGGVESEASGEGSSITGGTRNTATARWSIVSGGADRDATGEADWRAGTLFENF